ncbi:DUF3054 domain-containing protein [Halobacteria archaeon AArc-dxtr1]|nr:DUF3054 domain-containing protein [Halobacteria archaeon AArc-dxtr1]
MSVRSVLERDGGREAIVLGVVDVALLTGLVLYGHVHHGGDPLSDPAGAAETALPFLLGWLAIALLGGVYRRHVYADPISAARLTAVCWIAAANIGLLVRSSPEIQGGVAYPFGIVMTGIGLVALLAWRVGYAVFATRNE